MSFILWWSLSLVCSVSHLSTVTGYQCGRCDPGECKPLPPGSCQGGISTDLCDCCPVCAKTVNEECGGPYGLYGKCGEGLECAISPPMGALITGEEVGICREIISEETCLNVTCPVHEEVICPEDSVATLSKSSDHPCCSNPLECICEPLQCHMITCGPGYERVLVSKGSNHPGQCCDKYKCQQAAHCESQVCPELKESKCPSDSYRLPSVLDADGCCQIQQLCECAQYCPEVRCPASKKLVIQRKSTHQPGNCCTKFKCIPRTLQNTCRNETSQKEYKDGATWSTDRCTTCHCRHGIIVCKADTCSDLKSCSYMEIPEGGCCPVCKGCLLEDKSVKRNGETWRDVCKTCFCDNGVERCQQPLCHAKCENPRPVPGECCPVCEEEKMCDLLCEFGFSINSKGEELCECREAAPTHQSCPQWSCNKYCTYGYVEDSDGCPRCECNLCPSLSSCQKDCPQGFLVNEHGCLICRCADSSHTQATNGSDEIPDQNKNQMAKSCLTLDGIHHESGEVWYDGCRTCQCYHGKEMCSLVSCPQLLCDNPVFHVGDCCPSCPGTVGLIPKEKAKHGKCTESGVTYIEGEHWSLDNCTVCLCHLGVILCEIHSCPPLLCTRPVKTEGHCCLQCPEENASTLTSSDPTNKVCTAPEGHVYKHGDIWQTSPCQSCICRSGQIHCYSQICQPVQCRSEPVLRKGQCCPACNDDNLPTVCEDAGQVYDEGEIWRSSNCTECKCTNSKKFCYPLVCDKPSCRYLIQPYGQCCPSCIGESATTKQEPSDEPIMTALISSLSVITFIVIILLIALLWKLHNKKHAEPVKADIASPNAVHVQLLGYHKGDKSESKRKSWTGGQIENRAISEKSQIESMQRVSLCLDVNEDE